MLYRYWCFILWFIMYVCIKDINYSVKLVVVNSFLDLRFLKFFILENINSLFF